MNLVQCPICLKTKKTYGKRFHCCTTAHDTETYKLNKSKSQTPLNAEGEKQVLIATKKTEDDSNENSSDVATQEKEFSTPLSPSSEVIEEKELEIKEEDEFDPEKYYDHKCGNCGTYFTDAVFQKHNKCCPKCGEDYN